MAESPVPKRKDKPMIADSDYQRGRADSWERRALEAEAEVERLRGTLAHVINRVSTEGRDDERGSIFATGKAVLDG